MGVGPIKCAGQGLGFVCFRLKVGDCLCEGTCALRVELVDAHAGVDLQEDVHLVYGPESGEEGHETVRDCELLGSTALAADVDAQDIGFARHHACSKGHGQVSWGEADVRYVLPDGVYRVKVWRGFELLLVRCQLLQGVCHCGDAGSHVHCPREPLLSAGVHEATVRPRLPHGLENPELDVAAELVLCHVMPLHIRDGLSPAFIGSVQPPAILRVTCLSRVCHVFVTCLSRVWLYVAWGYNHAL